MSRDRCRRKVVLPFALGVFLFGNTSWALEYGSAKFSDEVGELGSWSSPGYVKDQNRKSDDVIRHNNDLLTIVTSVDRSLEEKTRFQLGEMLVVSPEPGGRGGAGDEALTRYTLGETDGQGGFKTINLNFFDNAGNVTKVEVHNIAGNPDADIFVREADDMGEGNFGSNRKFDTTVFTDQTKEREIIYQGHSGERGENIVSHVLSEFDAQTKEWGRVSLYEYVGESRLSKVSTYDTERQMVNFFDKSSFGDLLVEQLADVQIFDERKTPLGRDQNVLVKSYSSATKLTTVYVYDDGMNLKETRSTAPDGQLVRQ